MNRLAVMPRTLLMALFGVAGIVGMLLFTGAGDIACLLLAAVPLALGGGYAWRMRRAGARRQ